MIYGKHDDVLIGGGFEYWFDELTNKHIHTIVDDILADVLDSGGLHEYNGISTDWRFTYTGRGIF